MTVWALQVHHQISLQPHLHKSTQLFLFFPMPPHYDNLTVFFAAVFQLVQFSTLAHCIASKAARTVQSTNYSGCLYHCRRALAPKWLARGHWSHKEWRKESGLINGPATPTPKVTGDKVGQQHTAKETLPSLSSLADETSKESMHKIHGSLLM